MCVVAIPATNASATARPLRIAGHHVSVHHASAGGPDSTSFGTASAVVTGVDASSIPISISIGNPVQLPSTSGAAYSITTTVGMGQESESIRPKAQFNGNSCGWDGSYVVYECVTMYFNIKSDAYYFFADNAQDSIYATNYDPHDVVLASLSLKTGGSGLECNNGAPLNGSETWNISSPTSGNVYYRTPSWAGNYYRIINEDGNFQNVQGTLNWDYRGNVEKLMFTFTLPDSEGSWPHGGCS
jgi:hypothetical protein